MQTATRIPFVDYLDLEGEPQLIANACKSCGANYFDRRNACASCFTTSFEQKPVARTGRVSSFTIVHGGDEPYVSAIVDCAGVTVRTTLLNVSPDTRDVHLNMPVQLTTFSLGLDADGSEAIGYAFEPRSKRTSPNQASTSDEETRS